MNIEQIKNFINTDNKYKFIHDNPKLGKNICLLTLAGSYAYGTNTENSDIDIRGIVLESPEEIIGFKKFEQYVDNETDTTIFAFNKMISLFIACNPNSIEVLGCNPEHYIILNDIGKQLIKNCNIFLSKKCVYSFGGYANQQLRMLQNALCHDVMDHDQKINYLYKTLEHTMENFSQRYSMDPQSLSIKLLQNSPFDKKADIYINAILNYYPARDFHGMLTELSTIIRTYDKLNGRNKKKDISALQKHAMHLIRLYYMVFDILEKGEIITYRRNINPILLDIRNGKFSKENGEFIPEFWELVDQCEKKLNILSQETSLPDEPNYDIIQEFVMDINKRIINNNI